MIRIIQIAAAVLATILVFVGTAQAASLRVAPTNLSLIAPGSAETLTLRNEAQQPINVQVRVFRWTQSGGVESLVQTSDVVASPPATTLQSGAQYVVRIVRTAKHPVTEQESYRVVIDELPDPSQRTGGTVNLVLRHSIPVFFRPAGAGPAEIAWSLQNVSGGVLLAAQNSGGTSLRLADVRLLQGSQAIGSHEGLLGYVLPGAVMQWPIASRGASGASLTLAAETDAGPVSATVPVQ